LLTTIDKYKKLYGLADFKWSTTLTANALKTGKANGGGTTMNHQLNPGSMGQVITPRLAPGSTFDKSELGGITPFELSYNACMCEVPDSRLKCDLVSKVLNMQYPSTGHHDILVAEYKAIG